MDNNKLIKVNEGFFSKIIMKIKLFFFKNTTSTGYIEETNNEEIKSDIHNIRESIKVDITEPNTYQKEQIIKEINENPNILEQYSLSKLKNIEQYYKDIIHKNKKILAELKANN